MIELRDIRKIYPGEVPTKALDGISLDVERGEFLAITGPSGSGKSTLMHIMGFLDRPTSGVYIFEEKNIDSFTDDKLANIRNEKVGFVFQDFNLLRRVTVLENVELPLVYKGLSRQESEERARKALESVGLSQRVSHFPNQLSGGEKQRTAIARAIVNSPEVIFADEPTGNLDSKSGQQIMEILQDLNDKGHTIVLVTHERYTAEMARRVIHLKDGKILEDERIKNRRLAKDGLIK